MNIFSVEALGGHSSEGELFLCRKNNARKILVNNWNLNHMMLWFVDLVSSAWMRVGV